MQSIKEIKLCLEETSLQDLPKFIARFEVDERKGVQQLLTQARKMIEASEREIKRIEGISIYEQTAFQKGYELVAGMDEVGRGPLAGPVVAAVVILPKNCKIFGIDDSKKLSEKKRIALNKEIRQKAVAFGVGVVDAKRIDEINILQATYEAMREALNQMNVTPDYLLVDAVRVPQVSIPQQPIIHGDAMSISIGAASILAKVYRDEMMQQYHEQYPDYDFHKNKGYGSSAHIASIQMKGICSIHRETFTKNFISNTTSAKGRLGEVLTAQELKKMGCKILEKNYRHGIGEIDIIALWEDTILFIEVKYRTSLTHGTPAEAVHIKKQKRIIQTAKAYMAQHGAGRNGRFDVAEVLEQNGKRFFRYTKNAFIVTAENS